jgi:fluoride exporter
METLTKYAVVAAGGALGAMVRYALGAHVFSRFAVSFPIGTFIINVTGSFLIGFFLTLIAERASIHPNWRLAVAVGFLGSYTTFSAFEYETAQLLTNRKGALAACYVIFSVVFGLAALWCGNAAGRRL